jgi:hypothetical protein
MGAMLNKIINSTMLNAIVKKCLGNQLNWSKSIGIISILTMSLVLFSVELLIKKMTPRIGFTNEKSKEPHVTTSF